MKILLVEDSRAMAAIMSVRLASFGYEVCIAENGAVGVEKFSSFAPDLVLMDIEMPVMNGFDATARIRAIEATQDWAWTPIIFLTASGTHENLITAIDAGGDDFLVKTLPEAVLCAKMKAMARIARLRKRLTLANHLLKEQAIRDSLTGLCNRRHMDLTVDVEWEQAQQTRSSFALLMLDIDHFKQYNDLYGHAAGDDCLRRVARTLADVVERFNQEKRTRGALAARYGGEEFAVLMPDASLETYRTLADEVISGVRALAIPHSCNDDWGVVTTSIGGAFVPSADAEVLHLFRTADERLYAAKQAGRNRAVLS
ncbi:diguanylate cyclase [Methyloversatilis thermotolerans]|uniref:diguanylate cyclase n=1 Tax=Methyloversatilis thermotolerans TaxID=1346290 RepID=UPI000362D46A|nr:diguanylate cyclase [Methyloversatilis thermotolerans]